MTFSLPLRSWLLLAIASANLLVIGLTANSLFQSRQLYIQRAETLTLNVASAVDLSLSGTIGKIDLALSAVGDELEAELARGGLDPALANAFMVRQEKRMPEVEGFRASDPHGSVILGNGINPNAPASNGDRDYFLHHREHDDGMLFITKPVWGRIVNHYIIILSRRYNFPDGRFAGVVHATISLDQIFRQLSHFDLGRRGTIVVRDRDLGLIVRYPAIPDRPAGQIGNSDVSQEFRTTYASRQNSAVFHTRAGSDGIARIFAFQRIGRAPMLVNAGIATEDYLADWTDTAYESGSMALGFLLMSSALGVLLLRLLGQTIRDSTRNRIYLQNASDGVQIVDAQGRLVEVNDRFCALLGFTRDELLAMSDEQWSARWPDQTIQGSSLLRLLDQTAATTAEARLQHKDGRILHVEANFSSFNLDDGRFLCASIRDVTDRKAATERIEQLAFYDPLTKLPNRRLMLDRLSQALASSSRHHRFGAVMMIDMDDFKTLNDTHGHDIGDRFLVEVAVRLRGCLREGDTAARLGGDEFVVILEGLEGASGAAIATETVAEKILDSLRQPYQLELGNQQREAAQRSYYCTSSIGITLFLEQTLSVDELMKRADTAMYQAKAAGRNTLRFFDPQMQAAVNARSALELDLRRAIEDSQFQLFYQPQINASGECFGVEALLRWNHPERGWVAPGNFIPLAEETGLILPLGHWVLEAACSQIARWATQPGLQALTVSVNVSAKQFHQPEFVGLVLRSLKKSGASASQLKLELTESLLVRNIEDVISKMNMLKSHGVGFSLDDFGTGYSSLSYLKRMPLDQLKIDQTFVRDILDDPNDAAISQTIVALADSLGLQVLAEGVESEAQRDMLEGQGCRAYQGFLFSKPLPPGELEAFVKDIARQKQP